MSILKLSTSTTLSNHVWSFEDEWNRMEEENNFEDLTFCESDENTYELQLTLSANFPNDDEQPTPQLHSPQQPSQQITFLHWLICSVDFKKWQPMWENMSGKQRKKAQRAKSSKEWTPLMFAVVSQMPHKLQIMNMLLFRGKLVDFVNQQNETALTLALKYCHEQSKEVVDFLLEKHANPHLPWSPAHEYLNTPLTLAVQHPDSHLCVHFLSLFLKNDPDPFSGDWQKGAFLLELVIRRSCLLTFATLLDLLFNKGVNLNHKGRHGKTALMWVIMSKDDPTREKKVQLLLEKGANPNIQDHFGNSALMVAIKHFQKGQIFPIVSKLLKSRADPNLVTKKQETALMFACDRVNNRSMHDIIELLVIHGADIHQQLKDGSDALIVASRYSWKRPIKFLLDQGANLNRQKKDGITALSLAVDSISSHFSEGCIKLLLERGADPNIQDQYGLTPFLFLFRPGREKFALKLVPLFLNYGADVNLRTKQGKFALMLATRIRGEHSQELVRLLVKNGANIHLRNEKGYTAFELVVQKFVQSGSRDQTLEFLLEQGAQVNTLDDQNNSALIEVSRYSSSSTSSYVVELLLKRNARVNQRNNEGWNALMFVAQGGTNEHSLRILELLLENEISINDANSAGDTPLTLCASNTHAQFREKCLELLLRKGANPKIVNTGGDSALHILMRHYSLKGSFRCIELLIDHGALVFARNNIEEFPLQMMIYRLEDHFLQSHIYFYNSSVHQFIESSALKLFLQSQELVDFQNQPLRCKSILDMFFENYFAFKNARRISTDCCICLEEFERVLLLEDGEERKSSKGGEGGEEGEKSCEGKQAQKEETDPKNKEENKMRYRDVFWFLCGHGMHTLCFMKFKFERQKFECPLCKKKIIALQSGERDSEWFNFPSR